MEEFSKEGRKLRPRKSAAGSSVRSERVDFNSSDRSSSTGERRNSYGEHRSNYGERRSNYGEHRSFGEHRNYGDRRPRQGSEGRSGSFGEHRNSFGDRRPGGFGEHRSNFGEHRNFSDRKPRQFGEDRRGFGEERRNFGEERRNFGERGPRQFDRKPRQFGSKPGFKKGNAPHFGKSVEEGINRMINRRPVVNDAEYSDFDSVATPIRDEVRLNKFIANSGVCSRREADTLIQAGVVTVNGEVVTELGTKVNIFEDDIRFNGERLKGEEKVYIIMNKPKGFVTTASDPHAEKTVLDLLKGCSARVYPVGRLDKATTGVLMFTNDGEIAERLSHPSYNKKKIYQVALDRELSQEDHDHIISGITLTDGEVCADSLEYIDEGDRRKLGIEIHSGKNRIVRRIFESLGYTVKALDRVYFAGLTKKGLKKGEWRYLTEGEVNILKMGAYV